jgi:hypothetical protein
VAVEEAAVAEAEEAVAVGNYPRNLALRCVYAIPKRFGLLQDSCEDYRDSAVFVQQLATLEALSGV